MANHVHAVYSIPMPNRVLKLQIETNGMATIMANAITKIAKNIIGPTLYVIVSFLQSLQFGQLLLDGLVLAFSSRG
jgi:hypothetical protein